MNCGCFHGSVLAPQEANRPEVPASDSSKLTPALSEYTVAIGRAIKTPARTAYTVGMAKRHLRLVRRALPPLAICECCNKQFKSNLTKTDAAIWEIQTLFDAHKCERQDFAQNPERIVRQATAGK